METEKFTQILPQNSISKEVQFEILNPIGVTDTEIMAPVPRLKDFKNKRIGLFWNSKARGNVALKKVETLLKERFEGVEFNWFTTDNSTALAPMEIAALKEQGHDAIISSTGD